MYILLGYEDPDIMTKIFKDKEDEFPKIRDALAAWGRMTCPLRMIKKAKGRNI